MATTMTYREQVPTATEPTPTADRGLAAIGALGYSCLSSATYILAGMPTLVVVLLTLGQFLLTYKRTLTPVPQKPEAPAV